MLRESNEVLETAHDLLGVRGWKYSIWGDKFFVTTSILDSNFFSKHIYRKITFSTETENCSGGSWWLYLSGENSILWTILLKPRFYPAVVVSRSW